VIVYGATDAGDIAVRELLSVPGSRYRIVGFLDDDKLAHRSRFHGYSVLGGPDLLQGMIDRGEVDVVVIGRRAMDVERLKVLESMCRTGSVELIWLRIDLQRLTSKPTEPSVHAS
jgi:FlaA1/EpsC-like NDP-sugar epimerase